MNPGRSIEEILADLTVSVRNSTLETAAKIARRHGAPEVACEHILMLKGKKAAEDISAKILERFEVPNV